VDLAPDGEDGLHLALTEPYDAAVIAIMLPRLDGLALIDEMRRNRVHTPVIVLSTQANIFKQS
jgi:DNA-binding response OmpR family regulator